MIQLYLKTFTDEVTGMKDRRDKVKEAQNIDPKKGGKGKTGKGKGK